MSFSFIVAAEKHSGGIGYQGNLAWHIPEDLQLFKQFTLHKNVVMGRNSYNFLPNLKQRNLYALSNNTQAIASKHNQVDLITPTELFNPDSHKSEHYVMAGGAQLLNRLVEEPIFWQNLTEGWLTIIEYKQSPPPLDVFIKPFMQAVEQNCVCNEERVLVNNDVYTVVAKHFVTQ